MKICLQTVIAFLFILTSCQHKINKESSYENTKQLDAATTAAKPTIENHELTAEERKEKENHIIEALTLSKQNDTILILKDGLKTSLAFFPDTDYAIMIADTPIQFGYEPVEKIFHDFDNDGVQELILKYFSGGAHCCYESYIFRKTSKNKFEQIFYNEGGYMEVIGKNKIRIWVGGKFSYFYSCYGCLIDDSLFGERIIPIATLKFEKDRFFLIDEVNELRNKKLIGYLNKLSKRPVPPLSKDMNFDDGTRKLYALLIMEYFFNNKCNLKNCENLFLKYYKASDSKSIWIEIKNSIENCFEVQYSDFPHNKP